MLTTLLPRNVSAVRGHLPKHRYVLTVVPFHTVSRLNKQTPRLQMQVVSKVRIVKLNDNTVTSNCFESNRHRWMKCITAQVCCQANRL